MTDKSKKTQQKQSSGKFSQIEKRKKMITAETKKVVGGIWVQRRNEAGGNHNEIFVNI